MSAYPSDSDRPIAGFQYIPLSMEARGSPVPIPPFPGVTNGQGVAVRAGTWGLDWTFSNMTLAEMQWWAVLIGFVSGSPSPEISKRFVYTSGLPAARLWDIAGNMVNYRVAVVYMPTWTKYMNGRFHECVVKFRYLEDF